ncbi:MAG: hypothetical protein OEZ06_07600 [Myxococcales bacterium]|nr:hypothetical protein [Myxococcales bacterium]
MARRAHEKLEALADQLERDGADPLRIEVVRRAQRFKRSWVELAQGLMQLREGRKFEAWGYGDLHDYCAQELAIKAATVDKLLLSLSTVQRHAPEVLQRDGVSRAIPSVDAVDYFARALGQDSEDGVEGGDGGERRLQVSGDLIDELRSAVFDEGQELRQLRQNFNPLLYPKPEGAERRELLRKARSAARRFAELTGQVEGLSEARVARVEAVVEAVIKDLDQMLEESQPSPSDEKRSRRGREAAKAPA